MLSDGRPSMKTCACCGQALTASGRLTLRVDEAVLSLCNAAFEEAARLDHAEVDVAHFVFCLTRAEGAAAVFRAFGISIDVMREAAERWLKRLPSHSGGQAAMASAAFKSLLSRAEARAMREGRVYASLDDTVSVMADLTAPPLGSAREPAMARSLDGLLTTAAPQTRSAAASAGISALPVRTETDARLAALLKRLDQQEAELARLNAALKGARSGGRTGATLSAARTSPVRTGRETSSDGIYRPDLHELSTASTPDRVFLRRTMRQRLDLKRRRRNRMVERGAAVLPSAGGSLAPRSAERSLPAGRQSAGGRGGRGSGRSAAGGNTLLAFQEIDRDGALGEENERQKRFFLSLGDDVERAPSIGAKTAARLNRAGIVTVRDLLAADPEALAAELRVRFITAQRLRDWQAQARLVCTVPWLRGTHAQLLTGAGYPTADLITAAEPSQLCAAILKFAATRDGQSVLRSGAPPEMERILRWVENAALAEPERIAA